MGAAENAELVRRMLADVSEAGAWTPALERLSPDIEFETDPRHPSAGIYRGIDQYRAFLEEFEEPYERTIIEVERLFAKDDLVVTYVLARRTPHDSTIELERRVGFWWTLRDGKIVREQAFGDREQALEAAGMTDSDEVGVTT